MAWGVGAGEQPAMSTSSPTAPPRRLSVTRVAVLRSAGRAGRISIARSPSWLGRTRESLACGPVLTATRSNVRRGRLGIMSTAVGTGTPIGARCFCDGRGLPARPIPTFHGCAVKRSAVALGRSNDRAGQATQAVRPRNRIASATAAGAIAIAATSSHSSESSGEARNASETAGMNGIAA